MMKNLCFVAVVLISTVAAFQTLPTNCQSKSKFDGKTRVCKSADSNSSELQDTDLSVRKRRHRSCIDRSMQEYQESRRWFFVLTAVTIATSIFSFQQTASAIPMASVDEFATILRDSPLSVEVVEFSGPKSENVIVKLVDGTRFGIKDVVESSTDPRSPLKVAAACRESGVRTKFVDLEAVLSAAPKKKKLYTNQRVQEAQEKEKERLERIRRDEEDRLAQLARMEQEKSRVPTDKTN